MTDQKFVSPREFATIVGVHYHTVLEAIQKGQIRAVKVGRQYRIPTTELEAKRNIVQEAERGEAKDSNTDNERGDG